MALERDWLKKRKVGKSRKGIILVVCSGLDNSDFRKREGVYLYFGNPATF